MKEKAKQILTKTHLIGVYRNVQSFKKRTISEYQYKKSHEYQEFKKRKHFYSTFLKKGDLVFDIGANIGNRTEALLSMGAKVVAVEPQSNCVAVLKSKFGNNKDFHLFEGGMSDKKGEAVIHIANVDTISSMSEDWINEVKEGVFKQYSWQEEETVKVDTLDNLIKTHGVPAFIKIDVEGFELNVLKGLTQKVRYLSYEFMFPKFYDRALQCLDYIETLGEIECNFSWGESMEFANKEWFNSKEFRKELQKASETQNFGDIYIRFI